MIFEEPHGPDDVLFRKSFKLFSGWRGQDSYSSNGTYLVQATNKYASPDLYEQFWADSVYFFYARNNSL